MLRVVLAALVLTPTSFAADSKSSDSGWALDYRFPKFQASPPAATKEATPRDEGQGKSFNQALLAAVQRIPRGRLYCLRGAGTALSRAVLANGNEISIQTDQIGCTNCTTATYLATLLALEEATDRRLPLAFIPNKQADGVGVWGRWNANGPGVACLVGELSAGHNFYYDAAHFNELQRQAQPGDYVKIEWVDPAGRANVGSKEHGHLLILLRKDAERLYLWSANENAEGVGELVVRLADGVAENGATLKNGEKRRMGMAFLTRIDDPQRLIAATASLPEKSAYLASLEKSVNDSDGAALAKVQSQCGPGR